MAVQHLGLIEWHAPFLLIDQDPRQLVEHRLGGRPTVHHVLLAHREDAERIYDPRFCRMWEFYLAGAEMAFRQQAMMVMQIQLTTRQGIVPLTRDYIAGEEARLRGLEGGHRPPLRLAGE